MNDTTPDPDLIEQELHEPVYVDQELGGYLAQPQQSLAVSQADKLIELAISSNADMDKLERLLDLKLRYEAEEQRKAYTAAMAAFKLEGLVITKDKTVSFQHKDGDGKTSYTHATIGNVIGLASPLLAKHGITHHWDQERDQDRIKVRCVLTHKDGHVHTGDWWDGPPDNSGKKNVLQQKSSTVSYLERYSFLAITGLATKDQDDDGRNAAEDPTPEVEMISEDQQLVIESMITDNDLDMDTFLRWLAGPQIKCNGIDRIPVAMYDIVVAMLKKSIASKQAQA